MTQVIVGGTFTYSGDPSADDKDAVRFLIGDTDQTRQWVSDEEVLWALAQKGSTYLAAAVCARAMSAALGKAVQEKQVGDLRIKYADRAADLLKQAKAWEDDAAAGAVPLVGGISRADKTAREDLTDRIPTSVTRGMTDHPELGDDGRGRST